MKIKEILSKIESCDVYKAWRKNNSNAYLVHFFFMEEKSSGWQVGYYDKSKKHITSFILDDKGVSVSEDKEIFQPQSGDILKLKIEDVKIEFDEISKIAENYRKENYKAELPLQKLCVLQNILDLGQVWNITLFTRTFKTLNLKFDSSTGEIKSHELAKLFEFS